MVPSGDQELRERVLSAVRIKPLSGGEERLLEVHGCRVKVPARDGKGYLTYEVDKIFGENATHADVFEWVSPAVKDVAQRGINATVLAYGQTGSGKSHTMGTEGEGTGPSAGLIPRAAHALFEALDACGARRSAVHCSMIQIYGDRVFDALGGSEDRTGAGGGLAVREARHDRGSKIFVEGLSEYHVASAAEVVALMSRGLCRRVTRPTELNVRSSRSHLVVQLAVEVEGCEDGNNALWAEDEDSDSDSKATDNGSTKRIYGLRRAKLSLVDLAGSEKWSMLADSDETLASELKAINKSLSALGNCFAALVENESTDKRRHIPYRDSTLTRLLQDSLGGGSRTLVVANVAAGKDFSEETASTLAFAQRAKNVATKLCVDEVVTDALLLARARREISRLRLRLGEADPTCQSHQSSHRPGALEAAVAAAVAAADERATRRLHYLEEALTAARQATAEAERSAGRLYSKYELAEDRAVAANSVADAVLRQQDARHKCETAKIVSKSPRLATTAKSDLSEPLQLLEKPAIVNADYEQAMQRPTAPETTAITPSLFKPLSPRKFLRCRSIGVDPTLFEKIGNRPSPQFSPCSHRIDRTAEAQQRSISRSSFFVEAPERCESGLAVECERHSIRGCFLCRPQVSAQPTLIPADSGIQQVPHPSPCQRHRIKSCFLCSLQQDEGRETLRLEPSADIPGKLIHPQSLSTHSPIEAAANVVNSLHLEMEKVMPRHAPESDCRNRDSSDSPDVDLEDTSQSLSIQDSAMLRVSSSHEVLSSSASLPKLGQNVDRKRQYGSHNSGCVDKSVTRKYGTSTKQFSRLRRVIRADSIDPRAVPRSRRLTDVRSEKPTPHERAVANVAKYKAKHTGSEMLSTASCRTPGNTGGASATKLKQSCRRRTSHGRAAAAPQ